MPVVATDSLALILTTGLLSESNTIRIDNGYCRDIYQGNREYRAAKAFAAASRGAAVQQRFDVAGRFFALGR